MCLKPVWMGLTDSHGLGMHFNKHISYYYFFKLFLLNGRAKGGRKNGMDGGGRERLRIVGQQLRAMAVDPCCWRLSQANSALSHWGI